MSFPPGTPIAQIRIDQVRPGGTSAGTAGQSRADLWNRQQVNLVHTGTGTNPSWTLLAEPVGSAVTLNNPTSATAWFSPTMLGTYRVRLDVTGGFATALARCTLDSAGNPALSFTQFEPAPYEVGSESNYPVGGPLNNRGWDERRSLLMAALNQTLIILSDVTYLIGQPNEDGLVRHVLLDHVVAEGDGLGGIFRWSAASTAAHDGVNVIQPGYGGASPIATGRWERLGTSSPTGEWTSIPEFTTTDSNPVDKLIYTFPTPPPGWTYAGSTVQVLARIRVTGPNVDTASSPASFISGSAYVGYSGAGWAIQGPTDMLPYVGESFPVYQVYCPSPEPGPAGFKVYLQTIGEASSVDTFAGEYLVIPKLRLTEILT
jgi:hypothetical protein